VTAVFSFGGTLTGMKFASQSIPGTDDAKPKKKSKDFVFMAVFVNVDLCSDVQISGWVLEDRLVFVTRANNCGAGTAFVLSLYD
jgi:hypothetical protein